MDFILNKEEKIKAIDFAIKEFEKQLIVRLTLAEIDFDTFDSETFEPKENSSLDQSIFEIIKKISFLKEKKASIN